MKTLQELEQRIEEKIAVAHHQRHLDRPRSPSGSPPCQRFGEVADRLLSEIISPRIERLATYLENAEIVKPDQLGHRYSCLCRLRASTRFPATARLEVTLTHDEQIEHLLVLYRLEIGPIYIPYKGQVQLEFPINKVDEDQLIGWLDDQIVDFVGAYLYFEYAPVAQTLAVDPVCGMVLDRNRAAAQCDFYEGTTYYFCANTCRKKFEADPLRYLSAAQSKRAK
jgi:YHS domain-containing protein